MDPAPQPAHPPDKQPRRPLTPRHTPNQTNPGPPRTPLLDPRAQEAYIPLNSAVRSTSTTRDASCPRTDQAVLLEHYPGHAAQRCVLARTYDDGKHGHPGCPTDDVTRDNLQPSDPHHHQTVRVHTSRSHRPHNNQPRLTQHPNRTHPATPERRAGIGRSARSAPCPSHALRRMAFSCRSTSSSASLAVSRRSRTAGTDNSVRAVRWRRDAIIRAVLQVPADEPGSRC